MLGLFALASLMITHRTKEIGVRKVLGASVSNIVYQLSKDFTKFVVVAFVIACPIANFAMNKWLQEIRLPHRNRLARCLFHHVKLAAKLCLSYFSERFRYLFCLHCWRSR